MSMTRVERAIVRLSVAFITCCALFLPAAMATAQAQICTLITPVVDQPSAGESAPDSQGATCDPAAALPNIAVRTLVQAAQGEWLDGNKADTAPLAAKDDPVTWRILVTNTSQQPVAKLSIQLRAPLGVPIANTTADLGELTDWIWAIPELQTGQTATLDVTGTVGAYGEIDLSARLLAPVDADPADNADTSEIVVPTPQSGVLGATTSDPTVVPSPAPQVLAAATGLGTQQFGSKWPLITGAGLLGLAWRSRRRWSTESNVKQ